MLASISLQFANNVDIVARSNLENQRFRNTTTLLRSSLGCTFLWASEEPRALFLIKRKMTKKLLFHGNWLFDFSAAFLEIVPVCINLLRFFSSPLSLNTHSYYCHTRETVQTRILSILWLVFKVCIIVYIILYYLIFFKKKRANINFIYNVRCTNFKSWPWNK